MALLLHSTQTDLRVSSTVCAIERLYNKIEHVNTTTDAFPIAGDYSHSFGGALDPKWTRLKSSASNADKQKEGVRLEMHGGQDNDGQKQKAIVEFLCDSNKGDDRRRDLLMAEDEEDDGTGEDRDKKGEEVDDEHGGKLKLVSWDVEGGTKVLRLDWITKYGCEDVKDDGTGSTRGHWGQFLRLQALPCTKNADFEYRSLHVVYYHVSAIFISLVIELTEFLQCIYGRRRVPHIWQLAQL